MGKTAVLLAILLAPLRCSSRITVAFSPDGRTLVTTGVGLPVKVWDLASGKELRQLAGGTSWGSGAIVLPDGNILLTGDRKGKIRRLSATGGAVGEPLGPQEGILPVTAVSSDGRLVAFPTAQGIQVLTVETAKTVRTLSGNLERTWACAFSPDGKQLAAVFFNHDVHVWSLETGKEILKIDTKDEAYTIVFSPDGETLACGMVAGRIGFWNAADGTHRYSISATGDIFGLAYSPDGKKLASTGFFGTTRIWDMATRKELYRLKGGVSTVAFSPDGKILAAGGDHNDKKVWVWEADTGKELLKLSFP